MVTKHKVPPPPVMQTPSDQGSSMLHTAHSVTLHLWTPAATTLRLSLACVTTLPFTGPATHKHLLNTCSNNGLELLSLSRYTHPAEA